MPNAPAPMLRIGLELSGRDPCGCEDRLWIELWQATANSTKIGLGRSADEDARPSLFGCCGDRSRRFVWFRDGREPGAGRGIARSRLAARGARLDVFGAAHQRWIEEYAASHPQVSISYDVVGSGEGIKRLPTQSISPAAMKS
jgi:hypothetical protein